MQGWSSRKQTSALQSPAGETALEPGNPGNNCPGNTLPWKQLQDNPACATTRMLSAAGTRKPTRGGLDTTYRERLFYAVEVTRSDGWRPVDSVKLIRSFFLSALLLIFSPIPRLAPHSQQQSVPRVFLSIFDTKPKRMVSSYFQERERLLLETPMILCFSPPGELNHTPISGPIPEKQVVMTFYPVSEPFKREQLCLLHSHCPKGVGSNGVNH